MPLRLISPDGTKTYDLRDGVPLIVGRAPTCDLPVFDPTISRRHAELTSDGHVLSLRDLGSSNGTFVNGTKIEKGKATIDDLLTFGKVGFRLESFGTSTPTSVARRASRAPRSARRSCGRSRCAIPAAAISTLGGTGHHGSGRARPRDRLAAQRAAERQEPAEARHAARGLQGAHPRRRRRHDAREDRRLRLRDARGGPRGDPAHRRERRAACRRSRATSAAATSPRSVPQSIARKAVEEKVALLSDNAGEDERFGGQSIVMQQVRSAICAPLIGSEDRVLGVLYVDNPSVAHRFSEDDLEFLVAFAGIAAVAIENSQFAERIRARGARAQQLRALLRAAARGAHRRLGRRRRSSAATSGRWRCCSATSAASPRSPRR